VIRMLRRMAPRRFIPPALLSTGLFLGGCATVGHDFPADKVAAIQLHRTTQAEIEETFGPPWRTGIEDGGVTWTYGRYRYAIFSEAKTKDLVLRFDDQGVVVSYTFNTTEHEHR
jgi:hypothetical protein